MQTIFICPSCRTVPTSEDTGATIRKCISCGRRLLPLKCTRKEFEEKSFDDKEDLKSEVLSDEERIREDFDKEVLLNYLKKANENLDSINKKVSFFYVTTIFGILAAVVFLVIQCAL